MTSKLRFERETVNDLEKATSKEWLIWNGRGGYASSTIIGLNTRRYHGLLIAPMEPPWERKLFLSKLEEEVEADGEDYHLSSNIYPGTVHPGGYLNMEGFSLDPLPKFHYSFPGISIRKTIFMPYGRDAVVTRYEVENERDEEIKLRVRPLVNSRPSDSLRKMGNGVEGLEQELVSRGFKIFDTEKDDPSIKMGSDLMKYSESDLSPEDRWYRNMIYRKESDRRYEDREDHYNPGYFELPISRESKEFHILAAAGSETENHFGEIYSNNPKDFQRIRKNTINRLEKIARGSRISETASLKESWSSLLHASDSFLIENGSILAGYPWFSTWGRDALIALPGLTLVTNRPEWSEKILKLTIEKTENGLVPNRFHGENIEPNSTDASLLLIVTLFQHLLYTGETKIFEENWDVLNNIMGRYSSPKDEKVGMGGDGLIWVAGGTTWMDAKVDDHCVTPREGKPVEINSLWYNSLKIMKKVGEIIGEETEFGIEPDRVKRSFQKKFWNSEKEYLSDVLVGDRSDDSLRPNQLFTLSLPFPMLGKNKGRKVLDKVEKELETPFGLRSLPRNSANYKGRYQGDMRTRDLAYHQGTVWSWLIGPYSRSLNKFRGGTGRKKAKKLIESLLEKHLGEAGLGTISEVFDGDRPHRPDGCISQAWSVGEILRAYAEDVMGKRPPFEKDYLEK